MATVHFASIDLEDFYLDIDDAPVAPDSPYFDRQVGTILEILDATDTRCTFFVLGRTADRFPEVVKRIADAGHEIASHGYGHERVYDLTRDKFEADLKRSVDVLQKITGTKPAGYRAPYFSVTRDQGWFYEVLAENGFRYSSSIFNYSGKQTGVPPQGETSPVREFPMATLRFRGLEIPVAGGGFWRLLPAVAVDYSIGRLDREEAPFNMYLHPHEFDPVPIRSHRGRLRDLYVNLGRASIRDKFQRAMEKYRFQPFIDGLEA